MTAEGHPIDKCHCNDRVKGHEQIIHGEDGKSGLVVDVAKKIDKTCLNEYWKKPKSWVIALIISAIIIPSVLTAVGMWRDQGITPYVYAKKERVNANVSKINSNSSKLETIEKIQNDIKKELKEEIKDLSAQVGKLTVEQGKTITEVENLKEGIAELKQAMKDNQEELKKLIQQEQNN